MLQNKQSKYPHLLNFLCHGYDINKVYNQKIYFTSHFCFCSQQFFCSPDLNLQCFLLLLSLKVGLLPPAVTLHKKFSAVPTAPKCCIILATTLTVLYGVFIWKGCQKISVTNGNVMVFVTKSTRKCLYMAGYLHKTSAIPSRVNL